MVLLSTCAINDIDNLSTRSCSLPATLHINASECLAKHGSTAATVCSPARS